MNPTKLNCVADTSSLIRLRKGNVIWVLGELFSIVYLPNAVKHECLDSQTSEIIDNPFFKILPVNKKLKLPGIHLGELEAISLAKELNVQYILLDDKTAIKRAISVGLKVIGTFDVLILSTRAGLIPSVLDPMIEMRKNQEGISDVDFMKTLELAGER